jgi:hypothetical protein
LGLVPPKKFATAYTKAMEKPKDKEQKWKAQSESLQNAIKASRKITVLQKKGYSGAQIAALVPVVETPEADDNRVPCPFCGRKFAE